MSVVEKLECFGTANTSDCCAQCPDNEECVKETMRKHKKTVMEKLEQVLAEFPKFVADPTTNEENILKWLKDFASELDSFKKAELQRKASIVFKIRKMIDDLWKEYCVGQKCQGLLNCKICLECEIGSQKTAYKGVLEILDKPPMEACVIVPRNIIPMDEIDAILEGNILLIKKANYDSQIHVSRKKLEDYINFVDGLRSHGKPKEVMIKYEIYKELLCEEKTK